MNFLKVFVNFTRSKTPLVEIILILLSIFEVRMELKYDILIMIVIMFLIKDMDNELYEILVILPNKIKDIIKIRYLTIYLPISIGYGIGIFLFQGNINNYFYSLSLIFIYINSIIPLLYTKGMKITNDPLAYTWICFITLVFFFIKCFLNFSNLRFFNDIIGVVLVIGTFILSYRLSFLRIYGKGTR